MTERQRELIEGMNEFCTESVFLMLMFKMLTTENKQ